MASVWRKGRLKKLEIRRKVSGLVLVLSHSGVMAGWEVKHCFLLQLLGPFWAFSAPLLVTETANQNTQNGNVTRAMKTARKGESSGGREGGFAMILW